MRYAATGMPTFSAVRRQPMAQKSLELSRRHIRQVLILIAIAVVAAILFVWTRIQVIQLGYEVSRMRKEVSDLAERKLAIEAEVALLKSPERLERAATEVLGMRLPLADEIVFVEIKNGQGEGVSPEGELAKEKSPEVKEGTE